MTRWALAEPARWTLLYGTPVQGDAAPAETTNAAGTRVTRRVLEIAADAAWEGGDQAREGVDQAREGGAPAEDAPALAPAVRELLTQTLAEFDVDAAPETAVRAVAVWSGLVGVLSAHLFGQLGADAVALGEDVLRPQIEVLADVIAPR